MGNYIEANLGKDEVILEKAKVSWLSQFWYIAVGILTLVLLMFGLLNSQ